MCGDMKQSIPSASAEITARGADRDVRRKAAGISTELPMEEKDRDGRAPPHQFVALGSLHAAANRIVALLG